MLLLLLGMLFATGNVCYATLSTPTSSIPPPISVGAKPTISTDVTTSIQATDVKISIGGELFKTVNIRPSSITITNNGAAQYDSRVSVSYEVLTANTNVRVKVTFTPIEKADNKLQIKFEDTADVDEKTFTFALIYVDRVAAAISLGCIYGAELIAAIIIISVLKYRPPAWVIGIYVVSSCLAIAGIVMTAVGNTNGLVIAGIALASVGDFGMLVGIAFNCCSGKRDGGERLCCN